MWRGWRRKRIAASLGSVGLHARGLSFVETRRDSTGGFHITAAEFRAFDGAEPAKVLARLALDYDLKRVRCTTLLGSGDYRLIQTEAPDVKPDELKAALRWRIKDLIDFHLNDATIDVFDVPSDGSGRSPTVTVVVGRNDAIRRRVDLMHDAAIRLEIIDIPELAQRNLAIMLPQDRDGIALLTFDDAGGLITITRQGQLYLSRVVAAAEPADEAASERILLELQRSLDYFESSFRQSPVMNVMLAPASAATQALAVFLSGRMTQRVTVSDSARDWGMTDGAPVPDHCLLTLGAALREERVVP